MRRRSFVYKCERLLPPKKRQWSSGNGRGNAAGGKEGRGQCNQMAQNLQKLHKHTHAHTARKDTCGTCSNGNSNLQRTRKSLPGGSQAVQAAPCGRVPCVDFSLLRPSTVASSKPTAAAAAGRRQDEEEEEELTVTLPTVSTAAASLLLLLLLLLLACSCIPSTPACAPLLLSSWQWHSGFAAFVLPR